MFKILVGVVAGSSMGCNDKTSRERARYVAGCELGFLAVFSAAEKPADENYG